MHGITDNSRYFYHQTNTSRCNVWVGNNMESVVYVALFKKKYVLLILKSAASWQLSVSGGEKG